MVSFFNRLARKLFSGNSVRKPIRRQPVRLGLEALEDRMCPSFTWDWVGANGAAWGTASNWRRTDNNSVGVPAGGDTAEFVGTSQNAPKILGNTNDVFIHLTRNFHGTIEVASSATFS